MKSKLNGKTFEEFIDNLIDVLDSHAYAIKELYDNCNKLAEAIDDVGERNKRLTQALMRHDTVEIQ
jgi:hypothetical protein